ncbi:unnamed protein product [Caenorhabditis angaria]|uniref:Uncharacterized protein n=1 Tax=Caenorhabditis angaria TaxID=860376 RepID=A0A9P1N5M1_9PELO|nr:unnamed protein product [Caenorhabditis angaria]
MSEILMEEEEEEEEIVYDVANIEEIRHFDIGDDVDPQEIAAEDVEVWDTQKKRVGRKRGAEVIPIVRRQPPREARVKSFQQFEQFDDNEMEEEDDEEDEDDDELGEGTSKTWRVFVRNDGSGMHFDWPIYMENAISLNSVVSIISTRAALVPEVHICQSIPQEYTNTGTFVVKLEGNMDKNEIHNDGLGTWQAVQMFVRKYVIGNNIKPQITQKNDHNLKVVCEQFLHPGTDGRGDFMRKVYTGFDNYEHMIPWVVISYEWMGNAHPLTVYEEMEKQYHQNTWKKCANSLEHAPILFKHGCDSQTAISILLSTEKFTEYGKSLPMYVQESITFVLGVNSCGGHRALHSDGNEWKKPSGGTQNFRAIYSIADDLSSWRLEKTMANDCDIQIVCRRYLGKTSTATSGFLRKIYLVKVKSTCPQHIQNALQNTELCVISYSWRENQKEATLIVPTNFDEAVEEVLMVPKFDENMRFEHDLRLKIELKRKENLEKLAGIQARIERLKSSLSNEDLIEFQDLYDLLSSCHHF